MLFHIIMYLCHIIERVLKLPKYRKKLDQIKQNKVKERGGDLSEAAVTKMP